MKACALPYLIVGIVLLFGLTLKACELCRHRDNPFLTSICIFLASLTTAVLAQAVTNTIASPALSRGGEMLSDVAAMAAGCAGRTFLIHVHDLASAARTRRCYLWWAAASAAFVVLFLALPPSRVTGPTGKHTETVAYYVYFWYLAITLTSLSQLTLRYARLTSRLALRAGLRVLAAGCVSALAFLLVHAIMLVCAEAGVSLEWWDAAVAAPLQLLTELLLLAGVTIPAWGARIATFARRVRDFRSYRRLYPLWQELHRANPDLTLVEQDHTRRPRLHDVEFLLYRQVIEIRDGQLALRPYVDPRIAEIAADLARRAGRPQEDGWAVSEAAAIAAGITAKARGLRASTAPPEPGPAPGGTNIAAEVAWLSKVSWAFTHSPLVAQVLSVIATA